MNSSHPIQATIQNIKDACLNLKLDTLLPLTTDMGCRRLKVGRLSRTSWHNGHDVSRYGHGLHWSNTHMVVKWYKWPLGSFLSFNPKTKTYIRRYVRSYPFMWSLKHISWTTSPETNCFQDHQRNLAEQILLVNARMGRK